eukprot:8245719-Lingulodinium_polyedra.AAC.1
MSASSSQAIGIVAEHKRSILPPGRPLGRPLSRGRGSIAPRGQEATGQGVDDVRNKLHYVCGGR